MRNGTRLAALDLGSNSFRLEIGKFENGQITRVEYHKEFVRQGSGLDDNNLLSLEAMERGWSCLERFNERLTRFRKDHIRAVATQTLRQAENRDVFLSRACQILGFPIDVISGREEARLIYQGVANLLPCSSDRRLVVDIGGRSTELILGKNLDANQLQSFQLGSVTWSMKFFPGGKLGNSAFKQAEIAAMAELDEASQIYHPGKWDIAYGSSGTIGAIAEILTAAGQPPGIITRQGLEWLKSRMVRAKYLDNLQLDTLKDERKPVLAGGLAVLIAIFDVLQISEMQHALGALRQGVLYDLLDREQPTTDLRSTTVTNLMQKFAVDNAQATRVERTALQLFRQYPLIEGMTKVRERTERKMRWAARLHEIGAHISHSSYHRHGAYIMDNAEAPGFALPELHNLSQLILGQRGKLHKLDADFSEVPFCSQLLALRLAVILCHARRNPQMDGILLQRRLLPVLNFTLSVTREWAEAHPQSLYLLRQEVEAWNRIGPNFRLQVR